jgi:Spy/CpxP family protein refolding chaperone
MKFTKRTILLLAGGTLLAVGIAACNHGIHFGTPEERGDWMVEKVTKELELNTTQQTNLSEVKDEFLELRKTMRSGREQHRADILAMLQQPTLDRNKANEIVSYHVDTINTRSPAIIDAIGNFYDSLDNEQRAELRELMEHKMEHHRHRWN